MRQAVCSGLAWAGGLTATVPVSGGEYVVTDYGAVSGEEENDLSRAFDKILARVEADPDARRDGATVVIPHGVFYLHNPVRIKHNFVTVRGLNAGWRSGVDGGSLGGSRVMVKHRGAAFHVPAATPRISGLCFRDFVIDGLDLAPNKIGIHVGRDNDALQIRNLACLRLDCALEILNADAALISGNLLAECRSCLRLINDGKSNLITGNRMGAAWGAGITCFLEGQKWLNLTGNNLFPDGYANLVMKRCEHCLVTGNHFKSYYAGVLYLEESGAGADQSEGNRHVTIANNHILAVSTDNGKWRDNPKPGWDARRFGIVQINGDDVHFTGNTVFTQAPADSPILIVRRGARNRVADCLITSDHSTSMKVVVHGADTRDTTILDCARRGEVDTQNAPSAHVRYLPD